MRILYQFPLSHFCEKARWLLDYKELDYIAENVLPGVEQLFTQFKTRHKTLPVLKEKNVYISSETSIAQYLDQTYPEHNLIRTHRKFQSDIYTIEALAQEFGLHLQNWLFTTLNDIETLDIMLGERGYLRRFEKITKPILKSLIKKAPSETQLAQSEQRMYELIDVFNEKIVAQHGKYLVGDRLGLADIAVCSMLAPLLNIMGTPWENDKQQPALEKMKAYLLGIPLGQYVLRIYATERHARIDWRGI